VSFFSAFSSFYSFLGTSTYPSFILEYCKVFQLHTVYREKKDKPEIQAQKKLSTGFLFSIRQFFSQKRNLIKFTRKTLPTFSPKNNKLLPTKNTAGVALVIIGYNMGEAEKIERPSKRNTWNTRKTLPPYKTLNTPI